MPGAEADRALLTTAALAAGEVALGFSGATARRWEKPGGAGPVTEADLAVNDVLERQLRGARPGYGWLSEESIDTADRLARRNAFIVDPIDGTRSFMKGGRAWAIAIASVEAGQVIAGVVHLPALGLTYSAARGSGATLGERPIHIRVPPAIPDILATAATMHDESWVNGPPVANRHHRPSLAWRLALVAEGRFDAMVTLRPTWEWDIAAGSLIAAEAGATVTDARGHGLTFNTASARAHGTLAAPPALHRQLLARLSGE